MNAYAILITPFAAIGLLMAFSEAKWCLMLHWEQRISDGLAARHAARPVSAHVDCWGACDPE